MSTGISVPELLTLLWYRREVAFFPSQPQRKVGMTLIHKLVPAGYHNVNLDVGNLAGGVYFYRLETPDHTTVKKLVVLK